MNNRKIESNDQNNNVVENHNIDHSKMSHHNHETMTAAKEKENHVMKHDSIDHSKLDHSKMDHATMDHGTEEHAGHEDHHDHHLMMVNDFKRRFFVSLFITVPILLLSPMIQMLDRKSVV